MKIGGELEIWFTSFGIDCKSSLNQITPIVNLGKTFDLYPNLVDTDQNILERGIHESEQTGH